MLAPIDPQTTFHGLESEVTDARLISDVLYTLLEQHFGPHSETYVLSKDEGVQLYFIACMVQSFVRRVEEAFRVAAENDRTAQAKGGGE
jgi:hypothetical protein